MKKAVTFISFALIWFVPICAQAEEGQEAAEESDSGHHENDHHVAAFLGFTTAGIDTDHSHTAFTLGAEYEYRIPLFFRFIGIGLFGELVFEEHTEYILGVPILVHPIGGLKLLVAPSLLIFDADEVETEFLFRAGVGYDIHVSFLSITPMVSLDFVHEHMSLVYGLGLGIGF